MISLPSAAFSRNSWPSRPPQASFVESGLNASTSTSRAASLCVRIAPSRSAVSQTTTPPVTSRLAIDFPSGAITSASQRLAVLERFAARLGRSPRPRAAPGRRRLPVTSVLSSGLNATETTGPRWCIGSPRGRPEAVFQSRAVWSSQPVASGLAVSRERQGMHPAGVFQRDCEAVTSRRGRDPTAGRCRRRSPVAIARPVGLQATTRTGRRRAPGNP